MIKAICLDLDGLVFTKESFQHFKENLAPSVPQAKRDTVLALSPEMKAYKKGIINDTTYRERARNQLKISFTNEEIAQLLAENYTLDVEVEALAKALRKQGYKLCICSNNFPMRINALDQKFNFLSLFDVAIFSYEVGVLKPERGIFEALVKKSACSPSEILYADDTEEKLLGAQELGITTFVFTDFPSFTVALKKQGVMW